MTLNPQGAPYPWVLRVLHWAMLLLLAWLIWGGLGLEALGFSEAAAAAYARHKAVGMAALGLALLRLGLRLWLGGVDHAPGWRGHASLWTQRLLYALMLAYPITGYFLHATARFKAPLHLLGVPIPDLTVGSAQVWERLHGICLWLLAAVLAVHLLGALWHLVKRDGRFMRILPL